MLRALSKPVSSRLLHVHLHSLRTVVEAFYSSVKGFGGSLLWFTSFKYRGGGEVASLCLMLPSLWCGKRPCVHVWACVGFRLLIFLLLVIETFWNASSLHDVMLTGREWQQLQYLQRGDKTLNGSNTWTMSLASKNCMLHNPLGLTHDWDEEEPSDQNW